MNVTYLDSEAASDEELRALYDLVVTEHEELWNEDPVEPYEKWHKQVTTAASWRKVHRWVASDEGRPVGFGYLELGLLENLDKAGISTYVRPGSRRQGIARELLRPAVAKALAEGRVLLNGGGITDSDASTFSEALGAERKITERKSRMVLADVDRSMLEAWVDKAEERAAGYSLLAWDGPAPDEYLDKFVALTMVMNTAPRDDLEMDDFIETPERRRELEQRWIGRGDAWWTLVARHDASDELVGYTEIMFPSHVKDGAWQEATAVDPTHRDKGLGRWLKATNCLRLFAEKPHVEYVDTWNAFSNAPMLGINIAMGFEVVKSFSEYQIRTEALQERLG